jgi:hypothetical protein
MEIGIIFPSCRLQSGAKVMEKEKKKRKYEKPKVTKIKLDAKCAVLGFCKTNGSTGGPTGANCGPPLPACFTSGS